MISKINYRQLDALGRKQNIDELSRDSGCARGGLRVADDDVNLEHRDS
jgi:hypothetical protein